MAIAFQCIQCGAKHQANDRLAGRRVRCPKCNTANHVPETATAEATVVEAVEAEPVEAEPVAVEVAAAVAAPTSKAPAAISTSKKPIDDPVKSATASSGADSSQEDPDMEMPPRKQRDEDELDMTPMVDVTFLLLIFFMVTASFSLQKSIEMPRQQTDAPSTNAVEEDPEELDQVELQIDEVGGFLVLAADWEAETPGKQNLISKLRDARGDGGEAKLIIKVHEDAKLRFLVDGMDAGTITGYNEVIVTQVDEFN